MIDCTKKYQSNGQRVSLCYVDLPRDHHEDYPVVGLVGWEEEHSRWTLEGKAQRGSKFDLVKVTS